MKEIWKLRARLEKERRGIGNKKVIFLEIYYFVNFLPI
jgi:hypothetical protein